MNMHLKNPLSLVCLRIDYKIGLYLKKKYLVIFIIDQGFCKNAEIRYPISAYDSVLHQQVSELSSRHLLVCPHR